MQRSRKRTPRRRGGFGGLGREATASALAAVYTFAASSGSLADATGARSRIASRRESGVGSPASAAEARRRKTKCAADGVPATFCSAYTGASGPLDDKNVTES